MAAGIQNLAKVNDISAGEPGLDRILSYVVPKCLKLLWCADKVVEAVLLPESSTSSQFAIDLHGRKVLPGFTLLEQRILRRKRREQVDVIRHYNKVGNLIAITIEVQQTLGNYFADCPFAQCAPTMASIEIVVPAIGQLLTKLVLHLKGLSRELRGPIFRERIDAAASQEFSPVLEPLLEYLLRN